MQILLSIAGMIVILAIAVLLSSNRRAIKFRVVGAAFALQASLAALVLYTSWGKVALNAASTGVSNLLGYSAKGTQFIFGPLASPEIGGNSFAIAALPVIIFFVFLIGMMLVWAKVKPRETAWVLEKTTPIDMTPWKNAKWASLVHRLFSANQPVQRESRCWGTICCKKMKNLSMRGSVYPIWRNDIII